MSYAGYTYDDDNDDLDYHDNIDHEREWLEDLAAMAGFGSVEEWEEAWEDDQMYRELLEKKEHNRKSRINDLAKQRRRERR